MATTETPPLQKKVAFIKSEDWLSLLVGFFLLATAIVGLSLPALKLNPSILFGKISLGAFAYQTLISIFKTTPWVWAYFVLTLLASLPLVWLSGNRFLYHLGSFATVFALAWLAIFISSIGAVKQLGLEYVIFALVLGILVRNLLKLPEWLTKVSFSEYFVKIGLVLLGTSVIFGDILKAGTLGLIQALVVVVLVWYFAFWLGGLLKIEQEIRLMISSAVSICGVSAAIATSGAIQGDSKKLSYVVGLVLVVAIPMLIFMPMAAKYLGLPDAVAGAWLGGTIDTTGAVVASGELLGPDALKYSTVVKFSQNILLGVAALAISLYWSLTSGKAKGQKVSAAVIWERFPKFVLGFVAASLLYSFVLSGETIAATKDYLKSLQTVFFALSFASIGLETDFKALVQTGNGKPALVFVGAQVFNVAVTLVVSYLLFAEVGR